MYAPIAFCFQYSSILAVFHTACDLQVDPPILLVHLYWEESISEWNLETSHDDRWSSATRLDQMTECEKIDDCLVVFE